MLQLRARRGVSSLYRVTPDDALWLLRAVAGEGPVRDEVAATLVNGFVWARTQSGFPGTLAAWVRAYSQPVSPAWFPDGDKFRAQLAETSDPTERAKLLAKATARRDVHSKRTRFDAAVRDAVARALDGAASIPDNAVDYAASTLDASRKGYIPLTEATRGRNRLWTRPAALSWQGYAVEGSRSTGTSAGWVMPAAAAAAFVLVVLHVATKKGA